MRIEANSSAGKVGFTVYAENATERALLTYFTSSEIRKDCDLGIGGHTYECDYSAVTSFSFGWYPKFKPKAAPRKRKKRVRR